jgi:hypothetical protein
MSDLLSEAEGLQMVWLKIVAAFHEGVFGLFHSAWRFCWQLLLVLASGLLIGFIHGDVIPV